MWKNFSSSIGLLAIAMLAALYSSSAARDGRTAPAGIAAIIALAIAIWVGIRFVPRLAANVEWDWFSFLSRYQVTREGWMYLAAVLVVVFAAINTSNNLLYMVLSALLAVILLSGFLSGVNFRWLKIELRAPAFCFPGEAFPVSVQIRNRKTVFPSFSLHIEPAAEAAFRFEPFYLACVRAGFQEFQSSQAVISRRGRHEMKKVKVHSRYPFGFFLKWKDYPVDGECICYPEILPQDRLSLAAIDVLGSSPRFERGTGYDLYTIRDYVPSDSARHVHWKASAKTATLKTREYALEESRRYAIAFDRYGESQDAERFEKLVSWAASLAFHWIHDGIEVALITDEWKSGYGSSEAQLQGILRYLALVEMSQTVQAAAGDAGDNENGALVLSLRSS